MIVERQFVCYFHFVGWDCIQLGVHVSLAQPNVELHIPFGFIRIGWQGVYARAPRVRRSYGMMRDEWRGK